MIPTHPQRLRTMLRSMIEVIVPAIDTGNELARDQAQILVANLKLLLDQTEHGYEYDLLDLKDLAGVLRRLLERTQGGSETVRAAERAAQLLREAEPVAALHLPRYADIAKLVGSARAAVDALLAASHADGTADFRAAAIEGVLAYATSQNLRERVWLRTTGMDAESAQLPSPGEMIEREG